MWPISGNIQDQWSHHFRGLLSIAHHYVDRTTPWHLLLALFKGMGHSSTRACLGWPCLGCHHDRALSWNMDNDVMHLWQCPEATAPSSWMHIVQHYSPPCRQTGCGMAFTSGITQRHGHALMKMYLGCHFPGIPSIICWGWGRCPLHWQLHWKG